MALVLSTIVYAFAAIGLAVTLASIYLYVTTPSEAELTQQQDAEPEPFDLEDKKESCRPAGIRCTVH